jgi:hypothetical protein
MREQHMLSRLEDFIALARKGEKVDLTVTLNKQIFSRKFPPYTSGESEDEIDMYILSADYFFVVEEKVNEITKFYVSGIEGESAGQTKHTIHIANERLKMDYNRLKEGKIVFMEKFWDEQLLERI